MKIISQNEQEQKQKGANYEWTHPLGQKKRKTNYFRIMFVAEVVLEKKSQVKKNRAHFQLSFNLHIVDIHVCKKQK